MFVTTLLFYFISDVRTSARTHTRTHTRTDKPKKYLRPDLLQETGILLFTHFIAIQMCGQLNRSISRIWTEQSLHHSVTSRGEILPKLNVASRTQVALTPLLQFLEDLLCNKLYVCNKRKPTTIPRDLNVLKVTEVNASTASCTTNPQRIEAMELEH